MQSLYDVPAPAKLNLFLHVTGRREDGYHLLQSVFMLIDWVDTLHLHVRNTGNISREDLTTALPADDLVIRAARSLQSATGCSLGAHIEIAKSIPAQAGMGGGSTDAASTLLALNRLWKTGLTTEQLCQIGLQLGADVPFFLRAGNAWVEGIGEKITPLDLPVTRFLVVKPSAGLETAMIFSDPHLNRASETATIAGFAAEAAKHPNNLLDFGRNDLQTVAQRLCPEVDQAIKWIDSKGLKGRMTGSGSAVFAQLLHEVDLTDLPVGFEARVCSSLRAHPLLGWA